MWYFPSHLNIETSDACNRRCRFCAVPRRRDRGPPQLLDPALLDELLLQLQRAPHPLKIALHWGDEPLANPRFLDAVALCRRRLPRARWLLQTNGDRLTAELFDELRGFFAAIAINLYDARAARRLEALDLRLTLARDGGRIQHPGRLRPLAGPGRRRRDALVQINHKYLRTDWIERPAPVDPPRGPCSLLWRDAAIGHDGRLYLCCRDSRRQHPAGDLRRTTLVEAYNSPVARQLRQHMQQGRRQAIAMCRNCPIARQVRVVGLRGEAPRAGAVAQPLARSS